MGGGAIDYLAFLFNTLSYMNKTFKIIIQFKELDQNTQRYLNKTLC